jgi:hypothetical protein
MSWMPLVSVPATVVEETAHEHGSEDMMRRSFRLTRKRSLCSDSVGESATKLRQTLTKVRSMVATEKHWRSDDKRSSYEQLWRGDHSQAIRPT